MSKYDELKTQVELELGYAKEKYEKEKGMEWEKFNKGMIFAYESIMSKIKCLEEEAP